MNVVRSLDEVIVRVENKLLLDTSLPLNNGGSSTHHLSPNDSAQLTPACPVQEKPLSPTSNSNVTLKAELQERRVCEETNDAIWEETASPDTGIKQGIELQQGAAVEEKMSATNRLASRWSAGTQLSMSVQQCDVDQPLQELLDWKGKPQQRPELDLDIRITEPNFVALQDSIGNSKRLSDHLSERDFSFCAKKPDMVEPVQRPPSSSQRIVRVVSSSAKPDPQMPPVSPLDSWASPLALTADGEAEEMGVLRSESTRSLIGHGADMKLQHSEAPVPAEKQWDEEAGLSVASAVLANPNGGKLPMNKQMRMVTLSKKLMKTRTKSRLVEVSFPSSLVASSAPTMSARSDGAKKTVPSSPATRSARKLEGEGDEEDPFTDIDIQDKFRQGNLKPITVAQWVAFFVVMGSLLCSLTVNHFKGRQLWGLELWKWILLVLVVLCGRLVSGWLIRILVIITEKNFLLRKKVLYFVYGIRKGVQNCLWLGLVLLAWKLILDPRVQRSSSNHKALLLVTRLLECFLIAALIWLAKVLLIKSLASSFHVTTFFDRIQESLYNQHVLEKLLGPPLLALSFESTQKVGVVPAPATFLSLERGLAGKKDEQGDSIRLEDIQKLSTKNVSAGVMKELMNLVRHPGIGTLVTTFDENLDMENDAEEMKINSELEAKAIAKRIFKNVAQEASGYIQKEDLLRFVTLEDIPNVLSLFEGAKDTGRITKRALKNWVVKVYQERKALAHSLNDTKTAVKELHRMASVVIIVVIIVIWLLLLGIATTHVLVFVISQLLLLAFVFSNTVKQVFEAIIFLFVMHPFDVGDRCIIDGVQLVVEEMRIMTTVFLKPDNEKVIYPNSVLSTKPISNLYRSPDQKEQLDFSVHVSTPTEKLLALKEKITGYVEKKSEHWGPKFSLLIKELEDLNRMRISIVMQHTINFQNAGDRMNRRSDLLLELKRAFQELGIEYRLLPQQVQLSCDGNLSPVTTNYVPVPMMHYGQLM